MDEASAVADLLIPAHFFGSQALHSRLRGIRHTSNCPWANHKPAAVFFNIRTPRMPVPE
jgi:hypothetical protein